MTSPIRESRPSPDVLADAEAYQCAPHLQDVGCREAAALISRLAAALRDSRAERDEAYKERDSLGASIAEAEVKRLMAKKMYAALITQLNSSCVEADALRAERDALRAQREALVEVLRDGAELSMNNTRAAAVRHRLVAWGDRARAVLAQGEESGP